MTSATDEVRPEWLADAPEVVRGRVVRSADVSVEVVDLPRSDELDAGDRDVDEPTGPEGASAVTWALGYRSGFDSGRRDGFEAGHADGARHGHRQATEAAFARYGEVLSSLQRDAARHLDEFDRLRDAVAAQATELAFAIAEAVIGRELAVAADPGADAVRRALASLARPADAIARVHPDDVERLGASTSELSPRHGLRIEADATIEPGGCVLDAGATTVDAGIAASLERVRSVLGLADDAVEAG